MSRPTSPHDPPAPDPEPRRLSDRLFGVMLAGALLLATFVPVVLGGDARLRLAPVAAAVLGVAAVWPRALAGPHTLWLRLARLMSHVVHPVVMAIVFYGTITPIAWVTRVFGRDALRLRLDATAASYWEPRESRSAEHMRNQY